VGGHRCIALERRGWRLGRAREEWGTNDGDMCEKWAMGGNCDEQILMKSSNVLLCPCIEGPSLHRVFAEHP
jgi:hypothetical protein